MNALSHGLYAKKLVLETEAAVEFQEMLAAYLHQFQPDGPAEFDLVQEMVAAKWRQRRLWSIETDLLDDELATQKERLEQDYTGYEPTLPLAYAYRGLAGLSALPLLIRHESRLERAYSRALKTLLELQHLRNQPKKQNIEERTESQFRSHQTQEPPIPSPVPAQLT